MKFSSEVTALENHVQGIKIRLSNVRKKGSARWQMYGPEVELVIPAGLQSSYPVGRRVIVQLSPV